MSNSVERVVPQLAALAQALIAMVDGLTAADLRRPGGEEDRNVAQAVPLVGRLRCGEWLVFASLHDLMHLERLHRLTDRSHSA